MERIKTIMPDGSILNGEVILIQDDALTQANFAALVARVEALEIIVGSLDPGESHFSGESELPDVKNLIYRKSPPAAKEKK